MTATPTQLTTLLENIRAAESDEERIMSLTMLPKLIDIQNREHMVQAYNAIQWKFIHRLISSRDSETLMPQIGILIWSCFTPVVSLHQKDLLKRIPACAKLFINIPEHSSTILKSFVDLSESIEGCKALVTEEVIEILKSVLNKQQEDEIALVLVILENILKKILMKSWNADINFLKLFLLPLADVCRTSQTEVKFKTMELCVKLLCLDLNDSDKILKTSMPSFKAALKQVIKSKLSDVHRDSVILLSGMLYERDPVWLTIKKDDAAGKESSADSQISNGQLLTLLIHMNCAEIRIILDSTEKFINENDKKLQTVLPLCYNTLETIIINLVTETETVMNLDYQILESIRNAMQETFLAVIAFLVERHDLFILENNPKIINNRTTLLSLRAYSIWVSEESEVSSEELERLIPLVIYFINPPESTEYQDDEIVDPMSFLTPLLTHYTTDQDLVRYFVKNEGHIELIHWIIRTPPNQISDDLICAVSAILINIYITSEPTGLKNERWTLKLIDFLSKFMEEKANLLKSHVLANVSSLLLLSFRAILAARCTDTHIEDVKNLKVPSAAFSNFFGDKQEELSDFRVLGLRILKECLILSRAEESPLIEFNNEGVLKTLVSIKDKKTGYTDEDELNELSNLISMLDI